MIGGYGPGDGRPWYTGARSTWIGAELRGRDEVLAVKRREARPGIGSDSAFGTSGRGEPTGACLTHLCYLTLHNHDKSLSVCGENQFWIGSTQGTGREHIGVRSDSECLGLEFYGYGLTR